MNKEINKDLNVTLSENEEFSWIPVQPSEQQTFEQATKTQVEQQTFEQATETQVGQQTFEQATETQVEQQTFEQATETQVEQQTFEQATETQVEQQTFEQATETQVGQQTFEQAAETQVGQQTFEQATETQVEQQTFEQVAETQVGQQAPSSEFTFQQQPIAQVQSEPQYVEKQQFTPSPEMMNPSNAQFNQMQNNNTFTPEQAKKKKKKTLAIILAALMALVLILGVVYGVSVNNKMNAVQSLKSEKQNKENTVKENSESIVNYLDQELLYEKEKCFGDGRAVQYAGIMVIGNTAYASNDSQTAAEMKEEYTKCKATGKELQNSSNFEDVDNVIKKEEEKFYKAIDDNVKISGQIDQILADWETFRAFTIANAGDAVEASVFDKAAELASKVSGKSASSYGDKLSPQEVAKDGDARIKNLVDSQILYDSSTLLSYAKKEADNKSLDELKSEVNGLENDNETLNEEISSLEDKINEQEPNIWIPFK